MNILVSPFTVFSLIILSTMFVTSILQHQVKKETYMLINSIVVLPAIPALWMMTNELSSEADRFTQFYLPTFFTAFLILSLLYRLIRYKKVQP